MKLDELMPAYDLKAAYSVRIAAPRERVWDELLKADLTNLPLARRLMTLRSLGRRKAPSGRPTTLASMGRSGGGFQEIACLPEQEIVQGIIGRFWCPDAPLLRGWNPADFMTLAPHGQAKAAWNFHLETSADGTILSTETRVQCWGLWARIVFRTYWALIGFFSGLIRKEMLQMVKRDSEAPRC